MFNPSRPALRQILYRERWNAVVQNFLWTPIDGTHFVTPDKKKACQFGCIHGGGLIGDLWQALGEKRSRKSIINAYGGLASPCPHITIHIENISAKLDSLEIHAAAFPPSEFITDGEVIPLTEDALTLEELFTYVYPKRCINIDLLSVGDLFKLAEAVEKYEIFGAMTIWMMHIK
ncbi:hypothetical protein C0991_009557 [Blastosporella zonata]|nr:hypothetical protein C0991_009557 [Blastosporella zonata]